jgi:hypothetical protein
MELSYPWSRIATRNCPTCRLGAGKLVAGEPIRLPGGPELLPVTCDYCGHTLWFDLDVVKAAEYRDTSTTENFPY